MENINLKVGDSITLRFKSLGTSGYVWNCEMDKPGIVSVTPEAAATNLPAGQSPDEVFVVSGIRSGTVHLRFGQRRSWQKDNPVAVKEYEVNVQ